MTNTERISLFKTELDFIQDKRIREVTEKMLENLPEYFFKIPASTTGKYHPEFALGEGGLVRHTKAAVRIAKELFEILPYADTERDMVYSALILHDGCKCGKVESKYTKHEHPIEVCELIKEIFKEEIDSNEFIMPICELIASHMGKWNTNNWSLVVLPLPKTKLQNFVHMCDYLASRKQLEYKFE